MGQDLHADLAMIVGCDVAALGTAEAVTMLHCVRRLRGLLDSVEAALSNQLDSLAAQGRCATASDVLSRNAHVSAKEAARRERRAKALANTKAFGEALSKGEIAAEHADVLADLTAKVSDEVKAGLFELESSLLSTATSSSPEQFA